MKRRCDNIWPPDNRLMGTFMAPVLKPRGRPFQRGNPGRPPGTRNRVTLMLERLGEAQAEQLFHKVLREAMAGNVRCQQLLLDRIWPARKAQPIEVILPPINSSNDALDAIAAICTALGEGRL